MPTAPLLALLVRVFALKGFAVLTHLRFLEFSALATLLLACKFRAISQFFSLMRPSFTRLIILDTRRFVVSSDEINP